MKKKDTVLPNDLNTVKRMHEGVTHLLDKCVKPFAIKRNWNEFRDVCIHNAKVAEILVDYMNYLRRLYSTYSNVIHGRTYFKVEDGIKIVTTIGDYQKN